MPHEHLIVVLHHAPQAVAQLDKTASIVFVGNQCAQLTVLFPLQIFEFEGGRLLAEQNVYEGPSGCLVKRRDYMSVQLIFKLKNKC